MIDTGSNSITGTLFTFADDTSTTNTIVQGDTLKFSGGNGIQTTTSGDLIEIKASGITTTEIDANANIANTQLEIARENKNKYDDPKPKERKKGGEK